MKKLIAILVVFAVFAGAAFAQDGEWSISSNGQIGTRITADGGTVKAAHWDDGGANGDVRGNLGIDYTKGILKTGLSFNQMGAIGAYVELNGDKWAFKASRDLLNLFAGGNLDGIGRGQDDKGNPIIVSLGGKGGDLWGNFNFDILEGLFLEAAVNKESQQWNVMDLFGDTFSQNGKIGTNYFLLDLTAAEGLSFGIKLPNIFDWGGVKFVEDALMKIVVGVKYDVSPLQIALQFASKPDSNDDGTGNSVKGLDYGIRLGAKFTINDAMWAGLDFKGAFGGTGDAKIGFGAKFGFASGPIDASLTLKYNNEWSKYFDIAPSATFIFDIDPNTTQVKVGLDIGLGIPLDSANKFKFSVGLKPQLYYNFLGTGAGSWDTGLAVAYWLGAELANDTFSFKPGYLEVAFKWKF